MSNKKLLPGVFLLTFIITSCSGTLSRLIPESLDEKGEVKLIQKFRGKDTITILKGTPAVMDILTEMAPVETAAGRYRINGITVILAIMRCSSVDDAYGIYSSLTAMPRRRWEIGQGEMSYKSPYLAGYNGEYAFLIFSPSNPMNYGSYYERSGKKLLIDLEDIKRKAIASYHWKILPRENRYRDSIFYVKSRTIGDIDITDAYGATYQVKRNTALIFVEKFASPGEAAYRYSRQLDQQKKAGRKTGEFIPLPGSPARAFWWSREDGVSVICRYRWLIFLFQGMPSHSDAIPFIRTIFINMQKIRAEAVPEKFKK